jgi:hypothetical protein
MTAAAALASHGCGIMWGMTLIDRIVNRLESRIGPIEAERARRRAASWRSTPWRLKQWWLDPFTTKIHFYEDTRIEHRQFPYKLKVQAVEPLRDKIRRVSDQGGGVVSVAPGVHLMRQGLDLTGCKDIALVGMNFQGVGEGPDAMFRF